MLTKAAMPVETRCELDLHSTYWPLYVFILHRTARLSLCSAFTLSLFIHQSTWKAFSPHRQKDNWRRPLPTSCLYLIDRYIAHCLEWDNCMLVLPLTVTSTYINVFFLCFQLYQRFKILHPVFQSSPKISSLVLSYVKWAYTVHDF